MSTLAEIEAAIERLSPSERAKLSLWWQENFDPDEGLELREEIASELDEAKREIERGGAATWQQVKQTAKTASR
jgi:hypothetical protein